MDPVLEAELRQICEDLGFSLAIEYATQVEMTIAIRQINTLPAGARLTPSQQRALLENLRRAILRTGSSGFVSSVEAQAQLPRWQFLWQSSPNAARAFMAVLERFEIPVPAALAGGGNP